MDLTSVDAVVRTSDPGDWRPGDSWLAGGTVLYGYGTDPARGRPRRLLDLDGAGWASVVECGDGGLELAATCTVAEFFALGADARRPGLRLVRPCCDAFVASWKIWHVSTLGGNVATALPAGPMTSWLAGMSATAVLWSAERVRSVPVADLVTGDMTTALVDGELIRSFGVPARALDEPSAMARISLTERGRSAALVVTRLVGPGRVRAAVTASVTRPVVVEGEPDEVCARVATIPDWHPARWHDDVHGDPAWRAAMTRRLLAQTLAEVGA